MPRKKRDLREWPEVVQKIDWPPYWDIVAKKMSELEKPPEVHLSVRWYGDMMGFEGLMSSAIPFRTAAEAEADAEKMNRGRMGKPFKAITLRVQKGT